MTLSQLILSLFTASITVLSCIIAWTAAVFARKAAAYPIRDKASILYAEADMCCCKLLGSSFSKDESDHFEMIVKQTKLIFPRDSAIRKRMIYLWDTVHKYNPRLSGSNLLREQRNDEKHIEVTEEIKTVREQLHAEFTKELNKLEYGWMGFLFWIKQ